MRAGLPTQCETTQVRDQGSGAALFGFSKLYGQIPGGQAEYLRVPQAQYTHISVPDLGPIGDMAVRIARHQGLRVLAVDLVPERIERARARGAETIDLREVSSVGDAVRDLTAGRGADSVIDAVGMEAHGSPVAKSMQTVAGLLPDVLARPVFENTGVDRMNAVYTAIDAVRRGGTVSLIGVYGGAADPMPLIGA